ncbi:hypothetical protein D9M71_456830 [compost metagenome]
MPQVDLRIGLQQAPAAPRECTLKAHAQAAGQLYLGVVTDARDAVAGAVQRDLLRNQLGLRLKAPALGQGDGVTGLQRRGPGVAVDVQLVAAV